MPIHSENSKIFRATRLAPSPTGRLHLGHARTFLITWWLARQAGTKIFMRMDDLDAGRAKPEAVEQAYDDLCWLGMDWDPFGALEGGGNAIRQADIADGVVVQSRRVDVYERVLETLWQRGAIYPCTCTRAEIAASVQNAANAPHEGEDVRYPGTCRAMAERYRKMATGTAQVMAISRQVREETEKNVCWRLRVPEGPIAFDDLVAGPRSIDVAKEVGDFPLTRFFGEAGSAALPAAYQLACVVDDHAMAIDLVIRGDDLLPSTPRQILLYMALGWPIPRFAHLPLVVGEDGKRLAKRHGESRIAQFRHPAQGAVTPPDRIAGWAAWRSGQIHCPQELPARDIISAFELAKLPRQRVTLGEEDWGWLQP